MPLLRQSLLPCTSLPGDDRVTWLAGTAPAQIEPGGSRVFGFGSDSGGTRNQGTIRAGESATGDQRFRLPNLVVPGTQLDVPVIATFMVNEGDEIARSELDGILSHGAEDLFADAPDSQSETFHVVTGNCL